MTYQEEQILGFSSRASGIKERHEKDRHQTPLRIPYEISIKAVHISFPSEQRRSLCFQSYAERASENN